MVSGLLAFMSATGYAGMLNIKGIIPELLPPDELYARTTGRFRLILHNSKQRIPAFLIRLTTPQGETLIPFLAAQSSCESILEQRFEQRGLHPIGTVRISSPFPVNFFTRSWEFRLDDTVLVYPCPLSTKSPLVADNSPRSGERSSDSHGQDGELERISSYSGSEPLRAIHWKHAARSDELLVKRFGSTAAPPVIINPDDLPGVDREEQLSRATWLICLHGRQQPVGLQLDGTVYPPAMGRPHLTQLLKELALYGKR